MIDGEWAVGAPWRRVMAKGQLRSNKEPKKPKKDKAKSPVASAGAASAFAKQGPQAGSSDKKK
jgi:hypothetical protein